jgi:hypothetical protein
MGQSIVKALWYGYFRVFWEKEEKRGTHLEKEIGGGGEWRCSGRW